MIPCLFPRPFLSSSSDLFFFYRRILRSRRSFDRWERRVKYSPTDGAKWCMYKTSSARTTWMTATRGNTEGVNKHTWTGLTNDRRDRWEFNSLSLRSRPYIRDRVNKKLSCQVTQVSQFLLKHTTRALRSRRSDFQKFHWILGTTAIY